MTDWKFGDVLERPMSEISSSHETIMWVGFSGAPRGQDLWYYGVDLTRDTDDDVPEWDPKFFGEWSRVDDE